ncbi:MAG: outer membrane beta-barrel protein [Chitinophagaceae bacterium]|nr:outer membrane beta-barrel protein [Chitinophagaceae bacterium]
MPHNDIDNLFYEGIEGHSEYPSEKVWGRVEAELERKTAEDYRKKYGPMKRIGLVLLLILTGLLIYETSILNNKKAGHAARHEFNKPAPSGSDITRQDAKDKRSGQHGSISENVVVDQDLAPYGQTNTTTFTHTVAGFDTNEPALSILSDNAAPIVIAEQAADMVKAGTAAEEAGEYEDRMEVIERIAPLSFSLSATAFTGKKDMASPMTATVPGSSIIPVITNHTVYGGRTVHGSRLSLSAYVSPGITWNLVRDNKHHGRRRGGGNGGGNNGSGGSNGGNNGGNGNGGGRGDSRHDYSRSEHSGLAIHGGVSLHYALSGKWSAETGLAYLSSSTIINSKKIYAVSDNTGAIRYRLNSSSGYSYVTPQNNSGLTAGDSTVISKSKNTISYLGVPVSISYKFLSAGKFSLAASAGGQLNFLLSGKTTASFDTDYSTSAKMQGLQPLHVSLLTGLTGELALNKKIALTLSPAGQFGLSSASRHTVVRTKPNFLRLSAGVKLKL